MNFVPRRDPGVHQQVGHRVGDADQRMATPRGVRFAPAKQVSGRRVLIRMEGRPVDRVHDGGNPQGVRGQPAQDAALGAVRVNHVRPKVAEDAADGPIRLPIAPGMNRAPQTTEPGPTAPPLPCPASAARLPAPATVP